MRLTEKLYAKYKQDVYVTSKRDGSHSPGSFHPHGRAWDMRTGGVPLKEHKKILGDNFDVLDHGLPKHRHIEYDPKPF